MHEASCHEENVFVTLTYSDEYLPAGGSLDPPAFQRFMKRLRKSFHGQRVRFFQCGEYGGRTGRPHHHALLFGVDFWDKSPWTTRGGLPVFRSDLLESLWPFGQSEIGSVTFESAAYVARYVTKKVTGNELVKAAAYEVVEVDTGEVIRRHPEYATMSRRPGIGRLWLDEFQSDVYPEHGTVIMRGREMKAPRYYDEQFEMSDPEAMEQLRALRARQRRRSEESEARLEVRARVAKAKLELKGREL